MAYDKTNWRTGDPITQSRMNKIEEGIANAQRVADGALTAGSTLVTELVSDVNTLNTVVGENDSQGLRRQIGDLALSILDANSPNGPGVWAATQIHAATDLRIAATTYDSLDAHFVAIENAARQADTKVSALEGLVGAHSDNLNSALRTGVSQDNLGKRFNDLDTSMTALLTGYGALRDSINAAGLGYNDLEGHPSLSARLDNYEERIEDTETELSNAHLSTALGRTLQNSNAFESIDERFETIETEIVNARSSTTNSDNGVDHVYNTLDARLEAIETSINSNTTNIGQLYDTTVKYTEVRNDFQSTDTNKPISALRGKELRDIIGGTYDPYNTDQEARTTVTSTIASASNTAETNAKNYTDALLGQGFTTINTVAKVINDLDISTDTRLDAIETNLTDARVQTGVDDQTNEPIYQYTDLDDRFDTIEGTAAALRTDVNTIANELAMVDTGVIVDNNTRVDQLETDLRTMAAELNMLDGTAIKDTNSRVDTIEYNISHNTSSTTDVDYKRLTATETEDIYTYEVDGEPVTVDANNLEENEAVETIRYKVVDYEDGETITENIPSILEYDKNSYLVQLEENEDETGLTIIPITYLVTTTTIITDNTTGLTQRMTAAETRLGNIDNSSTGALKGLDDRLDAIDGGSALSTTNGTLGARVSAAESAINTLLNAPKSATVIINKERIIYNNEGVPTVYTTDYIENGNNTPITPTSDVDYLFETEVDNEIKYFYWKYIDNNWELISGGSGSGSGDNNAEVFNSIQAFNLATKEENKDYYVIDNQTWHHYRYIYDSINYRYNLIEIGQNLNTDYIKRYNITTFDGDNVTYLDLYEFPYGVNKASENIDPITDAAYRIARLELPLGGGGFDDTQYRLYGRVIGDQTIKKSLAEVQADGGHVILRFGYTCYAKTGEGENDYDYKRASYVLTDESGTIISTSNGNTISYLTKTAYAQNNYNPELVFDVTNYYTLNETNAFRLTLTANIGNNEIKTKDIDVYVNIVLLTLESTFSDANALSIYNSIEVPFTFNGMENEDYTLHVLLDNQPIQFSINRGRIIIAPNQLSNKIGVHALQIYASQTVNNETLNSNNLYYQLGLIGADNLNSIMLFSGTSLDVSEIEQYKILNLPYTLYIPNKFESTLTVTIRIDQVDDTYTNIIGDPIIRNEVLESKKHTYPFRINKMYATDEYYLVTISCADANTLIFKIHVKLAEELIEIRTNNLLFNFDPTNDNYTNTLDLEHRLWSQTNNGTVYKMQIPEGTHFDWRTGGWTTIKDENNNDVSCFCVKAGSRIEFVKKEAGESEFTPLTLFWHDMETAGSNFKCVFKIDNVKSPKAQFLTSLDNIEHRITQYGDWIEDKYQDTDLKKTLLSTYLNVKTNYIYYYNMDPAYIGAVDPATDNGDNSHDSKLGTTVLANEDASTVEAIRAADESDARKKNTKKIKEYIQNIYAIVNEIDPEANYNGRSYKTFLLDLLLGSEAILEEEEGKDPVEEAIIRNLMTLNNGIATVATNVYNTLMGTAQGESTEDIALMAAYREFSASGFNAITNGFVVEGKEKKDGIIAKLQFYIKAVTKSFTPLGNAATQTVSAEPISTNPNAKTAIYRVTIGLPNEDARIYEVNMADVYGSNNNLLWTKVAGLRDATVTESHHYGLELNASGSYIYLPTGTLSYAHSEGDIIEFEYNVNSELEGHIDSSVIIYEDGVPSAADIYTRGKGIFEQYDSTNNTSTAQNLTIGSDECDVYIFKMRLYDEALENSDILANFCADGLTPDDMSDRYNRNKKLVDVTSRGQEITPSLVAEACPDLRVIMIEAPRLTGGKTSFIGDTKIRCIYKNGRPEDNWVALNAYHAGQGTSSDNYGAAGRNLDIMFGFDGIDTVIVEKPNKNNYHFDPNYVSTLIKGIDNSLEANLNTILDAATYSAQSQNYEITTDGTGKVALSSTSVPNNWFNIKLNIASSENTNNAFLLKRFDTFLPYKNQVPARIRGRNLSTPLDIKNDMEFFNCVVFIKETGTPSEFTNDRGENRSWHFYGIGNIGDSKKTDSTRVNVPGDPQEFCVELSDNGLKNSEFSTGVFYTPLDENEVYTEHELSLTPTTLHECTVSEYTNNNGYSLNIANPDITTLYLIKEVLAKYTQYHRFMYINSQFVEIGRPIAFENLEVGIRYPVSEAEWRTSLNTYLKQLNNSNRAKGWDKSFEFRYDLTTKDGETIERNELEKVMNDMHQEVNKQKFVDLYEWVVMSSDDNFREHLKDWFIEKSPLYWYLFTERYTMIDSRAKNTFYHYGKIYISDDEYAGTVKDTLNNMTAEQYLAAHSEITDNGNITALLIATAELAFLRATAQSIYDNRDTFLRDDPQNNSYPSQINNGYRFELWDYDNDTALGINNNGQMVFEAGLEDIDKTTSGWVYNAAESVIWCRIRDNMYDKLSQLYIELKMTDCFNDESLIQQFDALQTQFPEELWRLDFERKYFRPFKDSGETTYLSSMANGRKKYQRRLFERNMAIYISSKYLTNASYIANDQISFRPNRDIIPPEEAIIIVKPYSTMYINFMIGNAENDIANDPDAKSAHVRVRANESYSIHARDFVDRFLNFQCVIYNACRIMSIEGIDKFECKQFIFSNAKKLTALKLGGSHSNSNNVANIGDLGLNSEIPLLEELDISNIRFANPPAELSLDRFPLLKKFNAENSNIRHFTFKDGGLIEEIKYFPGDMDKINFKNLYKLTTVEFQENASFSNLTEYTSENSYSDSYLIVTNMINSATVIKLILNDIIWEINDLIDLAPLGQLKLKLGNNMLLQGTITITGNWSLTEGKIYTNNIGYYDNLDVWVNALEQDEEIPNDNPLWPNLRLIVDPANKLIKWPVRYHYNNKILTIYVNNNTIARDPYADGTIGMPIKENTPRYSYMFGTYENIAGDYDEYSGWSYSDSESANHLSGAPTITNSTDLYAWFSKTDRTYLVRWYLKPNQLVKTSGAIKYGEGYNLENPTIPVIHQPDPQNLDKYFETCTINVNNEGLVTYSIFTGWDKLPTDIKPDGTSNYYDIYGVWETGTNISIGDLFADNTKKTAQLLTLSVLTEEQKTAYHLDTIFDSGTEITYNLGHDNNLTSGHLIIPVDNSNSAFYLNGSNTNVTSFSTAYQPLLENNDAFTFAIDYTFDEGNYSTNKFAILASCYHSNDNVRSGFGIFKNTSTGKIEVGFGDMYRLADLRITVSNAATATMRNIVVIRHPKNSPTIYIYSGLGDASTIELESPAYLAITRTGEAEFNSNAYLNIGQLISDLETIDINDTIRDRWVKALGTIHWAKYWSEDLGIGECKRIASWPHEQLTFAIASCERDEPVTFGALPPRAKDTAIPEPALYLTTCNSLMHGWVKEDKVNYSSFTNNLYYWAYANTRKLCNNRLLFSLPTELLSILCKARVLSNPIEYYTTLNDAGYRMADYTESTRDYLYAPSVINLTNNSLYENEEIISSMKPFPWKIPNNIIIYKLNTNLEWILSSSSADSQYFNIRFPYKTFSLTAPRIYLSESSLNVNIAESIGTDNLQSGDIYIEEDRVYIYVSNREINTYGLNAYIERGYTKLNGLPDSSVTHIGGGNGRGGWIRAESYWTRSLISAGSLNTIFSEVKANGSCNVSTIGNIDTGFKVNYIIAI